MQSSLIITILGTDRSGLVKSLSNVIKNHKGNWQESRMVRMDGRFAGLAHVSIDEEQRDALTQTLLALQSDDLQLLIKQSENTLPSRTTLSLELLGNDRQGIIHDITHQLNALNVNIEKLQSEQRIAPMSNETLFYAAIELGLPEGVTEADIQQAFEAVSDSLMMDVTFRT
jgi:glycine cleavage system regulatory protein